jgi:hypothetical protein
LWAILAIAGTMPDPEAKAAAAAAADAWMTRFLGREQALDAKLQVLDRAIRLARSVEQKRRLLVFLRRVPARATLKLLTAYLDDGALAEDAAAGAVAMASRLAKEKSGADELVSTMRRVMEVAKDKKTKNAAAKVLVENGAVTPEEDNLDLDL